MGKEGKSSTESKVRAATKPSVKQVRNRRKEYGVNI